MKLYYDAKTSDRKLCIGDSVIVKQYRRLKTDAIYLDRILKVTNIEGTKITARSVDGKVITRNISHFKQINPDSSN